MIILIFMFIVPTGGVKQFEPSSDIFVACINKYFSQEMLNLTHVTGTCYLCSKHAYPVNINI